jgi:MFS family permease
VNIAIPGRIYQTAVDWKVGDALRTPALWLMMVVFSGAFFTLNILTTHQVAYLQDLHYSPMMSATALGLMIGMSIIGRLVCGALGMRFEGRYLAAIFLTGMMLGVVALIYVQGILFIYLYSILTGIGFGGMIVLMPNIFGAYFGRTNYPQIIGWASPITTIVSAGSPALAGFLYDITGGYFLPFAIAAGFIFVSIIFTLLARPPRPPAASTK